MIDKRLNDDRNAKGLNNSELLVQTKVQFGLCAIDFCLLFNDSDLDRLFYVVFKVEKPANIEILHDNQISS